MEKITLIRKKLLPDKTFGELWYKDKFLCYTLEDTVRDEKIYGETAIPYGTYKVIVNVSNRFKQLMPLLLDVPDFKGIRLHAGNLPGDTNGCVLVGTTMTDTGLLHSAVAYSKVLNLIKKLVIKGLEIEIKREEIIPAPVISEPIVKPVIILPQEVKKTVQVTEVKETNKPNNFLQLLIKIWKIFQLGFK